MQELLNIIRQQCDLDDEKIQDKLDECIAALRNISIECKYHYKSPELLSFYQNFKLVDYAVFHKMVLHKLMKNFRIEELSLRIPVGMKKLYEAEFERIRKTFENDDFIFDWQNDLFAKDIGICSGRLLPIGPGLLEVSGVPRILFIKNGVLQFLKFAYLLLFKLRRRHPILVIHTHLANVARFNPEGWENSYNIIAELLKSNPQLTGLMRSSWFIDPIISVISPKLAYLSQIPTRHGADIFYYSNEGRHSGAFARSKSRLTLFEKEEYTPKIYFLVWPRDRLIQYVQNCQAISSS